MGIPREPVFCDQVAVGIEVLGFVSKVVEAFLAAPKGHPHTSPAVE
ncbi:MAG: hypothetical protein QNJ97_24915 [Myxococcota bacterium]|nr:hypothetical protein [Myxococcota bacterium]